MNLSSQSGLPIEETTTDTEIMQLGAEYHLKQKYNELAAKYYEASIENESLKTRHYSAIAEHETKLREINDDNHKQKETLEKETQKREFFNLLKGMKGFYS